MAKQINDKIDELKAGVDWFYSDDFKLEDASEKYRALTNLAKEIEKDLVEMKNEINVIEEDFSIPEEGIDEAESKEDNPYFSDALLGFVTGYNTEQMTIIGSPIEEYTDALRAAGGTAASDIYCVTLTITVEGDEETEQKVIDELSHNPSLRIVNFNWITLDPITYLQEDGTVLVYQSESKVLSFTVNLYMTDKTLGQEA